MINLLNSSFYLMLKLETTLYLLIFSNLLIKFLMIILIMNIKIFIFASLNHEKTYYRLPKIMKYIIKCCYYIPKDFQ